jgi:predicted glutamine amidotransferase
MCRLAAFPPDYPRDKALEILLAFEGRNTDGVGSVHVKNNKFVVDKHPTALSKILAKDHNFLGHMPFNGWTLAHLRLASHGCNHARNTHPFVVGDWGFIHNGVWSDYNLVKLALSKSVKFEGETDTEVAAHLWNIIGPQKFAEELSWGGVFMGLHRNGQLHVAKTSGDLDVFHRKNKSIVLASQLPPYFKRKYASQSGWFHYNKDGTYKDHKFKVSKYGGTYHDNYGSSYMGNFGGGVASVNNPSYTPSTLPIVIRDREGSAFSRLAEIDETQFGEEMQRELAQELGISEEELNNGNGIPTYVSPSQRMRPEFSSRDLDEDDFWNQR